MAFDPNEVIKPVMFDNLNEVFDEQGSTFIALRRVQWVRGENQPDKNKSKLELRKWRITPEGDERADKGFSFLTEQGPHELAKVLVHNGYGKTKDIITELAQRDDFVDSVKHLDDKNIISSSGGEFFDIRKELINKAKALTEGVEDEE